MQLHRPRKISARNDTRHRVQVPDLDADVASMLSLHFTSRHQGARTTAVAYKEVVSADSISQAHQPTPHAHSSARVPPCARCASSLCLIQRSPSARSNTPLPKGLQTEILVQRYREGQHLDPFCLRLALPAVHVRVAARCHGEAPRRCKGKKKKGVGMCGQGRTGCRVEVVTTTILWLRLFHWFLLSLRRSLQCCVSALLAGQCQ